MSRNLMKGNEALAHAAILAGCTHFFGYPITPQNEIPEYLARELPKAGGVFLQAESELAAINMVYGAAAAGARPLTTSSSPGIALMQEGMSLLAAAQLPSVIVNVQRGGPGVGTIQPSQGDYYQMTRGGGNGDYRILTLAPSSAQEGAEMMLDAFELAEEYLTPVFILSDGLLGQMMEPVELQERPVKEIPPKPWAAVGHNNQRDPLTVKTLALDPYVLEEINNKLQKKYKVMSENESRHENYLTKDAEIIFCAYGSTGRIAKNAVDQLRHENVAAGLIRPQTLWPFPNKPFETVSSTCAHIISTEMSCGQMIDDVRLAVHGRLPVSHYGRCGGIIPTPEELAHHAKTTLGRV